MSSKVVTWITLGLAVVALGVAGYFLISSQSATKTAPPCTPGQDPNCPQPQTQMVTAAVYCGYTDGRAEEVLTSAKKCEADTYWSYHEIYPHRQNHIDNPNPQTPPPPPEEPDPNEIGACFITLFDPSYPPPAITKFYSYITTYQECLNDDKAFAFCVDETATEPDNCEYFSQLH
ncbi:MAG: hypothetical protein V1895_03370 [Parcubacteria group bacterium]